MQKHNDMLDEIYHLSSIVDRFYNNNIVHLNIQYSSSQNTR
jgi:hypothetical protein